MPKLVASKGRYQRRRTQRLWDDGSVLRKMPKQGGQRLATTGDATAVVDATEQHDPPIFPIARDENPVSGSNRVHSNNDRDVALSSVFWT